MTETSQSTLTPPAFVFMLAVPLLVAVTVATHPADPLLPEDLGLALSRYIWIHLALLVLIPLLGIVIWMLMRGLVGPPASVTRFLLFPAVAMYAAFDALVGIATGVLAREALNLEPSLLPGASALMERWTNLPAPLSLISGGGTVLWVVTVGLAGYSHLRSGSSRLTGWALLASAPLFGWGHPRLTGVLGMAALLVAVVAHHTQHRSEPATPATP